MKRLVLTLLLISIFISFASSQHLKKGFKAIKKGDYINALINFKEIDPPNAASEFGLAVLYFDKNYDYDLRHAFSKMISSYEQAKATGYDQYKNMRDYFSEDIINNFKKDILDTIMNSDDLMFSYIYEVIEREHSSFLDSEQAFKEMSYDRITDLNYKVMKAKVEKQNDRHTLRLIEGFININKNWKRINEVIDYKDSIEAIHLWDQRSRLIFLRTKPDNKYAYIARSAFIKNYSYYSKRHIVIKTSNALDDFVDSIIKNDNMYFHIRSEYEIENSIVKDKYYLCIKKQFSERYPSISIFYGYAKELQKKYPDAFMAKERSIGDAVYYTVFSEDKIYMGEKLIDTDYQGIVYIGDHKEFDDSDHYGWFIKMSAKTFNKDIKIPHTFADDYSQVGIRRIYTNFYTNVDISKFGFNYKPGGILFVRFGKKPKFIKYPECLDTDNLIREIQSYFTNLSGKEMLREYPRY